jgi:hypothetical protein
MSGLAESKADPGAKGAKDHYLHELGAPPGESYRPNGDGGA